MGMYTIYIHPQCVLITVFNHRSTNEHALERIPARPKGYSIDSFADPRKSFPIADPFGPSECSLGAREKDVDSHSDFWSADATPNRLSPEPVPIALPFKYSRKGHDNV